MTPPGGRRGRRNRAGRSDPVSIGAVLDDLLQERTVARGLPIGRLAAEWTAVVGERLASETSPASLERGVLTVAATDGPWGAQARFLADEILRQANAALGQPLVTSVRIIVRPDRSRSL